MSQNEYDKVELAGITLYYKKDTEILHRADGPAVEYGNGQFSYYVDGKQHREDGPAVFVGGTERWYIFGKLHRDGGPAEKTVSGRIKYYKQGKLHRLDGPAYIDRLRVEYWVEGVKIVGEKLRLLKIWVEANKK